MSRVAFASDHIGYDLKTALVDWARRNAHVADDHGTHSADRVDYPRYAARAVRDLAAGRCRTAVLVCGSGVGMAIAANRFPAARAVVGHSVEEAVVARGHNDANVLCLGSRVTSQGDAIKILAAFLDAPYEGGRHRGRVAQLTALGGRAAGSAPAVPRTGSEPLAIDFAPGPTAVDGGVLAALARPVPHHKSAEFAAMLETVTGRLRRMTGLTGGHMLLMSAAGTGGVESACWNLCAHGDRVVVLTNGHFGDRIVAMARAQGLSVEAIESAWTRPLAIDRLTACLDEGVAAVFMVHLETSTGQVNDVRAVAEVTRRAGVPLVVDAVSSLGALPVSFAEHGFDVLVSSTQKGLAAPPGVGIVAFTDEVWRRAAHRRSRSLYFSWERAVRAESRDPAEMLWTPPIPLVAAVHAASAHWDLGATHAAGRRRRLLSGMRALGFGSYLPESVLCAESPIHAFRTPPHLTAREFRAAMAEAGWFVAGGLGELSEEMIRVASYYPADPGERRLAMFLRDAGNCVIGHPDVR
ncbi:RpiB/LacA/LacB family sugar-phosphate isomerase [Nonomuraea sp. MG754425]|uniref:RpiB/LacA/LacB family sugar-phosphate isomerase n=1 Tax=Nonomuraea sp. MG754425 TaxID=2570319 RepID=UPI001F279E85|nr:RpiB/LacA/LacB family sugar-phosphate isomerase [Nonomuraea sp. MG754425]